jgi:hypothetical protein
MNFEPDISDDCLLVDGGETTTLHATTTVSVADAKRGPLSLAEIEFRQLGLESSDLAWSLPGVNLEGVEPRQGDVIEDASGVFWVILSASKSPLTLVWRVVTRRQL